MSTYVLGIDTSVYTTSVSAMDGDGHLLGDERLVLEVPSGQKGLRQSEGLFQHIGNLPKLLDRLSEVTRGRQLQTVVFSEKPRPVEDSYLPVFRAGASVAHSVAAVTGARLLSSTHQAGHIWAGVWSSPLRVEVEKATELGESLDFLSLHLSGGTTELVKTRVSRGTDLQLSLIGETSDLNAGQFVDRVGVALGLPFPSGPHLEDLAKRCSDPGSVRLPTAVQGLSVSFSGPTSAAMRLISQAASREQIAYAVFESIGTTLEKWLRSAREGYGLATCLLVGGVMSNRQIRQRLEPLAAEGFRLFFAENPYSSDNSVGLSYLGSLL